MNTDVSRSSQPADHKPVRTGTAIAAWLIVATIALWGLFILLGYLITHPLKNTGLVHWDASVEKSLATHRSGGWNTVTHYATYAAETPTVIALGAVAFVVLRLVLHRWRESVFLAVALIGEVTIFLGTTAIVDRARPPVPHLDNAPPTSSFPSGHTAASVALFGSLAVLAFWASSRGWLRGVFSVLAVGMPLLVATSRLYRGMHFPTDVMGGALLSVIWLSIVSAVLLVRPTRER